MSTHWTSEREAEFVELSGRLLELQRERDKVKTTIKNAIGEFCRNDLNLNPGSPTCVAVERILFEHRAGIATLYSRLPQLIENK